MGVFILPETSQRVQQNNLLGGLSSKAISSITAYGKVLQINGDEITLSNLGDSLKIIAPSSARIYSFASGPSEARPKIAAFSDIKVGGDINAVISLLPGGRFQASSIIILPEK